MGHRLGFVTGNFGESLARAGVRSSAIWLPARLANDGNCSSHSPAALGMESDVLEWAASCRCDHLCCDLVGLKKLGAADEPEKSPNEGQIESVFPKGPALILLDELVIYMGRLTPIGQKNLLGFLNNLMSIVSKRPQTVLKTPSLSLARSMGS